MRTMKLWIALCFKGSSLSTGTAVLHIKRIKQSIVFGNLSPLLSLWQDGLNAAAYVSELLYMTV